MRLIVGAYLKQNYVMMNWRVALKHKARIRPKVSQIHYCRCCFYITLMAFQEWSVTKVGTATAATDGFWNSKKRALSRLVVLNHKK